MPWYAQRADLPDTHKQWADPGSQHEAVLGHIGYVEVPAPGAEPVEVEPVEVPPVTLDDVPAEAVAQLAANMDEFAAELAAARDSTRGKA